MTKEEVLEKLLNEFKNKVKPLTYNTLFKDIKIYSYKNSEIVLTIDDNQNDYLIQTLEMNYKETIEETINDITNDTCVVKFIAKKDLKEKETKDKTIEKIIQTNNEQLENDVLNYKYNSSFNEKLTFDTFVVGKSNKLAWGTALEVAKNPGNIAHNPFFLYAKSGLGKTHLLHAIGNYIVRNSDKKVLYVTAEQFKHDFIVTSNTKGNETNNVDYINAFREKYRDIDVLIIDDIQQLEGNNPKTQMEFFNTFNALKDSNKQIIMASDRSINDFKLLEERLKTRFGQGLIESIEPPEIELRREIIVQKIIQFDFNINLSDEILDFLANNCGSDVRHIEGIVKRLYYYKIMFKVDDFSLNIVKGALEEYLDNNIPFKANSVAKILDTVAKYYGLEVSMLKGKMKKKEVTTARSIAMYLCKVMTSETLERIGLEIGGRNHATVIYSCDKIDKELKTNLKLQEEIKILKEKIRE